MNTAVRALRSQEWDARPECGFLAMSQEAAPERASVVSAALPTSNQHSHSIGVGGVTGGGSEVYVV
jgi:hypothetical protein